MGLDPLPSGFWLCLAGTVVGGALALAALWCLLRRVRKARVRRLGANQDGSTIIEFPFAMIVLILCALLTWQLGYLVSAYLVVDYAAFAAVRSAIVTIPEKASDTEPEHVISDLALEEPGKGAEIQDAAAFVLYPVSPAVSDMDPSEKLLADSVMLNVKGVPGIGVLLGELGVGFAERYTWSQRHTDARIIVEVDGNEKSGGHTFSGGDVVTVEVTHDFGLGIPVAAPVFGSLGLDGYTTRLKARASMLYEGFPEKVPGEENQP